MNIILQNYKSREILLELLKRRDFVTEDYEGFDKNEIDTMTRNNTLDMLMTTSPENTPLKKVYVKYLRVDESVSEALVNHTITDLYENSQVLSPQDMLVIVSNDEPNDKLQLYLTNLYENTKRSLFVTVLNIRRLQFNVLKHELQPREIHILTAQEKADLFAKLNIRSNRDLPEISRFDPLALALFLRPGEVCRFVRDSPVAITAEYYRVCV